MEIIFTFLILTVFFYFLILKISGNLNKNHKVITLVVAVTSAVLICWIGFNNFKSFIVSQKQQTFNQKLWLKDPNSRWEMRDDLVRSRLLIGKDSTAIKRMLGLPTAKDDDLAWVYHLGTGVADLGFLFSTLAIHFEDGKVKYASYEDVKD